MLAAGTENGVLLFQHEGQQWRQVDASLQGKTITSLAISPVGPGPILAGASKDGVYCAEKSLGFTRTLEADVWALAVTPNGTLFAGVEPAGVYRSKYPGAAWEELAQVRQLPSVPSWTFPVPPHIAHLRSLQVVPAQPDTLYGGIEVGGVIRSQDGGATWEEMNQGVHLDIHTLAVSLTQPSIIYAATGGGIYRSQDAARSWSRACQGLRYTYTIPVVVHPQDPYLVFTASAKGPPGTWYGKNGADATLYRSKDGALTWEPLSEGIPLHLNGMVYTFTFDPADPDHLCVGTSDGIIFHSRNQGDSWSLVAEGLPGVRCLAFLE